MHDDGKKKSCLSDKYNISQVSFSHSTDIAFVMFFLLHKQNIYRSELKAQSKD